MVVEKVAMKAAVIDVAVRKDSSIRKKQDENLEIPESERGAGEDVGSEDNTVHGPMGPN